MSDLPLSVLIPAAGSSQRLGQAKQLVQLSGKPLLQLTIELAATLQPLEIIVVTGASSDKIQPAIAKKCLSIPQLNFVFNPDWKNGIGSSIATGISTVAKNAKGVMVLLADQWKIKPDDLQTIKSRWLNNPEALVVSNAGNFLGPPVIFPRDCFATLAELDGDQGASSVIKANINRVLQVPIVNANADLDTPEDLNTLQKSQKT